MIELLKIWQETRDKDVDTYLTALALLEEIITHKREIMRDLANKADQDAIDELVRLTVQIRAELRRGVKDRSLKHDKTLKQILGPLIGSL